MYVIKFNKSVREITVTLIKCNSVLVEFGICVMKYNFLKIDAIAFDHCNYTWKNDISRHYAATIVFMFYETNEDVFLIGLLCALSFMG